MLIKPQRVHKNHGLVDEALWLQLARCHSIRWKSGMQDDRQAVILGEAKLLRIGRRRGRAHRGRCAQCKAEVDKAARAESKPLLLDPLEFLKIDRLVARMGIGPTVGIATTQPALRMAR